MNKRCWAEVDLEQLERNVRAYAETAQGMEIMAVVKADAYGHGDRQVAGRLQNMGIAHFAVSNIDEGIRLRGTGIRGQILLLGYTPVERAEELAEYDITQALLSEEYAERMAGTGIPVKCQFAIDTGMRRIGLNAENPEACEAVIRKYAGRLNVNGLFTHLCVADTPDQDAFTEKQIARFEEVARRVADLRLPFCHCMNSAGGLWHHTALSRMVRLGIIMYGLKPDTANVLPTGIQPVMSWKSVISLVKEVRAGDTVGYGRTFTAPRSMRLATIPAGYADGYPRALSNRGYVLIQGRRAPIVGRVCMDQMMVDVTDVPGAAFETAVTLMGRDGEETLTADDLASMAGTIGYEIVCGISKRVERVYLSSGAADRSPEDGDP